jgi:hypothetical protein
MKHSRDLLGRARWRLQHLCRDVDQGGENILNNLREDVLLLAEPKSKLQISGNSPPSNTTHIPESPYSLEHRNTSSMYLADDAASKEKLDVREKTGPSFREIVSNDSFEGVGDLNGDAARWRCSK